jgi:hypothetical protein
VRITAKCHKIMDSNSKAAQTDKKRKLMLYLMHMLFRWPFIAHAGTTTTAATSSTARSSAVAICYSRRSSRCYHCNSNRFMLRRLAVRRCCNCLFLQWLQHFDNGYCTLYRRFRFFYRSSASYPSELCCLC